MQIRHYFAMRRLTWLRDATMLDPRSSFQLPAPPTARAVLETACAELYLDERAGGKAVERWMNYTCSREFLCSRGESPMGKTCAHAPLAAIPGPLLPGGRAITPNKTNKKRPSSVAAASRPA